MIFPLRWNWLLIAAIVMTFVWVCGSTGAQSVRNDAASREAGHEAITGVVTDPSGAVIRDAVVTLRQAGSATHTALFQGRTNSIGQYEIPASPGEFVLTVEAVGFAASEQPVHVEESAGRVRPLHIDVTLGLQVEVQQVDVNAEPSTSRGPASLVLSREEINTMPIDPAALMEELQSLAGGPDATLLIDGFSGFKLPPLSQIREVRINQNPYSAQNDTNPVDGTIQILTRPGTDQLHGEAYLDGNTSALDARNPFAPNQPAFYAYSDGLVLTDRLLPATSYVVGFDDEENHTNSLVVPESVSESFIPSSAAIASPLSNLAVTSRLDFQPGTRATVNVGYKFVRTHQSNGGVGQLALASQAFDNLQLADTFQFSYTQALGESSINDLRLQFLRSRTTQTPASRSPTILVEGSLLAGGNNSGDFSDHQNHVEVLDYVSLTRRNHSIGFGGRLRSARDANYSLANFNGEFIFSSVADYQASIVSGATRASQYSVTTGNPSAVAELTDLGVFIQDDWKLLPTLTVSYGLRYESQSFIPDHNDPGPRAGFSWSFGRKAAAAPAIYLLHGGAGLFYRRFPLESALAVTRQNGINQQEYVVADPAFFEPAPTPSSLGSESTSTIYGISSRYHSPYYFGSTIALDRRLGRRGTVSVSWIREQGVHTPLIENVNAPLPGTYNPADPASGVRPLGGNSNLYRFASDGVFRSTRLSSTINFRTARYSIYGFYTLRFDRSDAETNGMPSNPYDIGLDFGRADGDTRHAVTVRGSADVGRGFWTSGYIHALSGAPFDIVVSQDLNGDTIFNDRPAFATDLSRPSVVVTPWGSFDTDPQLGQRIIPRNYGQGPSYVMVTVAAGKDLKVTRHAAGRPGATSGGTLQLWVESQNVLNHANYTLPVGTLGSPLFGQSTSISGASTISPDRTVDFHLATRF